MRSKFSNIAFSAGFGLALTFTISCGEHGWDEWLNDSSSSETPVPSSSSVPSSGVSSSSVMLSSSSLQSSSSPQAVVPVYGEPITDARDGQTYKTVVIGSQTWMAKNLNYEAEDAKCYGEGTRMFSTDSIAKNCEKYGRLYSWATAMSVCPESWHLPSRADWAQLADYVGAEPSGKLMATSSDWPDPGTDDYGFSALPGGTYDYSNSSFSSIYGAGSWWSTTEFSVDIVYDIVIIGHVGLFESSSRKSNLFSVRCIQGPRGCTSAENTDTQYCLNESGTMKEYGSVTDKGGKTYKTVVIGEQTWMAENLDYEVEYSKCYDNKPENCERYGRLYDWLAATDVCPNGWHLPSSAEWATLKKVTVGNIIPYSLMARSGRNGVDSYGFSALGGGRGYSASGFGSVGSYDYWWTSTENANKAEYWYISSSTTFAAINKDNEVKTTFHSVRCVKD